MIKNGGFPPIKYCKEDKSDQENYGKTAKERFFANAPRQNINIRQLLSESAKKKPIIITDDEQNDELEVVNDI